MAPRRNRRVVPLGVCASLLLLWLFPIPALAVWGEGTGSGSRIGLTRTDLLEYARLNGVGVEGPKYEYAQVADCPGATLGNDLQDAFCTRAIAACRGNTPEEGLGPAVQVWRRMTTTAAGDPATAPDTNWDPVGLTCLPELVPGATNTLTMAHIIEAFHDTAFTHPTLSIQPVGLKTLVNLPTYFETTFPTAGYGPGETDTTTILGHTVRIRPDVATVTYHFGDGTSLGPIDDLGGPHPTGTIRHTYTTTGTMPVRADATYTAQFQVGGSGWLDIPGDVTITGTTSNLQVLQARARLVSE